MSRQLIAPICLENVALTNIEAITDAKSCKVQRNTAVLSQFPLHNNIQTYRYLQIYFRLVLALESLT